MTQKTLFDKDLTFKEAKELIENGSDVNSINIIGLTPLYYVQNVEIAQLLIKHGANVNHQSNVKITPLFYSETIEIAKLLIAHGADVNHRDYNHHSILYNINHQFTGLFISAGAIPSEITTYYQLRHLFSEEQREAFDMFITITSDDNDFFQMCLAYQNDIKNHVKIEIKDMEII